MLLEEYLDAYIAAASTSEQKETPLFRNIQGKGKKQALTERPLLRTDTYAMVRRRLVAARILGDYCSHSFRATGITTYLENGTPWRWLNTSPVMPAAERPSSTTGEDRKLL